MPPVSSGWSDDYNSVRAKCVLRPLDCQGQPEMGICRFIPPCPTANNMKEKLQEYALIAEIVGAAAVVISLIYVGVGVRQNTDAILVANHQALVAMDMEKNTWLRDPSFAAIYTAALEDIDSLDPASRRQFNSFVADTLNAWEFAFITYNNGMMDLEIWNGWDGFYRREILLAPYRTFWQASGQNFSPVFKAYVDGILAAD